ELEHADTVVTADPVDLRAKRAVAASRHVRHPFEKLVCIDPAREVVVGQEPIVRPVDLAGALRPRGCRHRDLEPVDALEQALDQRSLAGPRRTRDDEDGPRRHRQDQPRWLKRSTSSVRWRSERPPTVFDWLIRHWLRSRAAFTRPNLGTAMSMSKTFAVSTHSGGSSRMASMLSRPAFRSRLSCARRTRTSFARWSASILWSSERAGA